MTDFPSYAYGTVSVDADGTVVTGTDTLWSGVNARAGDDITIAGHTVIIVDVTDETHLAIDAWPYDAVTDGEYKITQRSPLRFVGAEARADVTRLLSTLEAKGLVWTLDAAYASPSDLKPIPTANEGQLFYQSSTGKFWEMTSGAWTSIASPYGLQAGNALSEIAALGSAKQTDARVSIGAISETDMLKQPLDNTFWGADGGPYANINRVSDRIFIGGAVLNDGIYYPGGGVDRPSGFTDIDWLGQLARASFNGGDGVGVPYGNDVNYSQAAILADSDSTPGGQGAPLVALTLGIQSIKSLTNASPRGLNIFAVNNADSGQTVPIWAIYAEAHRLTDGASNTYGAEIEVRNSVGAVTGWNPYAQSGVGTIGVEIAAGCGLSSTGQYDATAAMYISANPMKFGSGIIFNDGSIGTYGIGSTTPAVLMPHDYDIQWFVDGSTLAGRITADLYGNLRLSPGASGAVMAASNVLVPDGDGVVFGSAFSTYFTGSGSANILSFVTSSTERIRIKSDGAVRFVPIASDPSGGEEGDVYFNSTSHKLRFHNGTSWADV